MILCAGEPEVMERRACTVNNNSPAGLGLRES